MRTQSFAAKQAGIQVMVFPLQDDNSLIKRYPGMILAIMMLNGLMFGIELSQGPNLDNFIHQFAIIPQEFAYGIELPPAMAMPYWISPLTAMFMHAGYLHLITNLVYLGIFGENVEDAMGHARFIVFYLLCGLGAAASYIFLVNHFDWSDSAIPSLGASGAISGILASYALMFPQNRVKVLLFLTIAELPALTVIGIWFFLQFFSGIATLTPNVNPAEASQGSVAYAAHVGGFVTGLLLTPVFVRDFRRAEYNKLRSE